MNTVNHNSRDVEDVSFNALTQLLRRDHDPLKLNAVIEAWERNPNRHRELLFYDDEDESDEESVDGDFEIDLEALQARDDVAPERFVPASEEELEFDAEIDWSEEEEGEEEEEEDEEESREEEEIELIRAEEVRGRGEERRTHAYNLRRRNQNRITQQPTRIELPPVVDRDRMLAQHDSRDRCVACNERRVTVAVAPCGHTCTCLPCLTRMQEQQIYQNASGLQCLACGARITTVLRFAA